MVSTSLGTNGKFIDVQTLPATGIYLILLNPSSTLTGSVTLFLYAVPPDQTSTITIGGPAVTVSTTVPGQNASLSFSGTAGQKISLNATGATFTGCYYMSILNPDGTALVNNAGACSPTYFSDALTLPASGTYTIVVNPGGTTTGSITLQLYAVPADGAGTITIGGPAVTVTTTVPGQNGSLTFSGTAGQRISLYVTAISSSLGCPYFSIVNPDGTILVAPGISCATTFFTDVKTLPATGTYTVVMNPSGAVVGSATFSVYDVPPDASGTITIGGLAVTVTTMVPGQNGSLTFSGTAGQRISLYVTAISSSLGCPYFSIVNPDGTILVAPGISCATTFFTDVKTLPATGTYTVVMNPSGAVVGSATFSVYDVPPDASGTITIGGLAVTVTTMVPGQNASLTFSGTAGQQATVHVTGNTMGCETTSLLKPDGSALTSVYSCSAGSNLTMQSLPTTGSYSISVDPGGTNIGSISLAVSSP